MKEEGGAGSVAALCRCLARRRCSTIFLEPSDNFSHFPLIFCRSRYDVVFLSTSSQRLIFVPQDSDDESSSGSTSVSDQSEEGGEAGHDDDSSSSDDNDSAVAAHAAAIGHSPLPPQNVSVAMAPVGATAAVAAGMGANVAPAGNLGETVSEGSPKSSSDPASEHAKGKEDATEAMHTEVSPSSDGDGQLVEEIEAAPNSGMKTELPKSSIPRETSGDATADEDVDMAASDQETGTRRMSVVVPPPESNKAFKNQKKKTSKRSKTPTYYCPYDLNERDDDENTALHIAIHARKLEHVKLLIEAGASVHKKCDGSAPVHTAISIGAIPENADFAYDCTVLLGENGADLSAKDDSMHTPLFLACAMNLPQVASYVLSDSVGMSTLNARADRSGGRALHAAAKFDSIPSSGLTKVSASSTGQSRAGGGHHHPDGTIAHSGHHIPGLHGKVESVGASTSQTFTASAAA